MCANKEDVAKDATQPQAAPFGPFEGTSVHLHRTQECPTCCRQEHRQPRRLMSAHLVAPSRWMATTSGSHRPKRTLKSPGLLASTRRLIRSAWVSGSECRPATPIL